MQAGSTTDTDSSTRTKAALIITDKPRTEGYLQCSIEQHAADKGKALKVLTVRNATDGRDESKVFDPNKWVKAIMDGNVTAVIIQKQLETMERDAGLRDEEHPWGRKKAHPRARQSTVIDNQEMRTMIEILYACKAKGIPASIEDRKTRYLKIPELEHLLKINGVKRTENAMLINTEEEQSVHVIAVEKAREATEEIDLNFELEYGEHIMHIDEYWTEQPPQLENRGSLESSPCLPVGASVEQGILRPARTVSGVSGSAIHAVAAWQIGDNASPEFCWTWGNCYEWENNGENLRQDGYQHTNGVFHHPGEFIHQTNWNEGDDLGFIHLNSYYDQRYYHCQESNDERSPSAEGAEGGDKRKELSLPAPCPSAEGAEGGRRKQKPKGRNKELHPPVSHHSAAGAEGWCGTAAKDREVTKHEMVSKPKGVGHLAYTRGPRGSWTAPTSGGRPRSPSTGSAPSRTPPRGTDRR